MNIYACLFWGFFKGLLTWICFILAFLIHFQGPFSFQEIILSIFMLALSVFLWADYKPNMKEEEKISTGTKVFLFFFFSLFVFILGLSMYDIIFDSVDWNIGLWLRIVLAFL